MVKFNRILSFFAVLLLFCVSACGSGSTQVFIGSYFDEDFRYTLPLIVEFYDLDSALMTEIGSNGSSQWLYLKGDSLINDRKRYHFTLQQNSLILKNSDTELHFTKTTNTSTNPLSQFAGKSYQFQTENGGDFDVDETWEIGTDSILIKRSYYYQNIVVYTEIERTEFIRITYNNTITLLALTDEGRPFEIYECLAVGTNLLIKNTKSLEKSLGKLIARDTAFKGVNFFVSRKQHIYQYYQFDHKPMPLNGYNWLKKESLTKFAATYFNVEDGFITLRFVLNEMGNVGRFELEQMNQNYKSMQYPTALIIKIIEIVSAIEWDVAQSDKVPEDCKMFLVFKIENGKLTDVYV